MRYYYDLSSSNTSTGIKSPKLILLHLKYDLQHLRAGSTLTRANIKAMLVWYISPILLYTDAHLH